MSKILNKLNNSIDEILNEDYLDDLRKEWEANNKIVDKEAEAEKIRALKLAGEKTTVVKRSEDPTVADVVTITTKDPETDITAVEKISPDQPTTNTITTRERIDQLELQDILRMSGTPIQEPIQEPMEEEEEEEEESEELNEFGKENTAAADKAYTGTQGAGVATKKKKKTDESSPVGESQINEDLTALDLHDLIKATIQVDKHKSKLGEDKDVIVLAMNVKQSEAAKDLMSFIERGYSDVIDADSIASENIDGDHMVFVEFERKDTFPQVLAEVLEGVEKLSGIDKWMFKHHKSERTLTMEELNDKLPLSPEAYDAFLAKEKDIQNQLEQLKINARIPLNK